MPRIRSVHPGLFTDEAFVSVSQAARLLWIGIWTEADDQGLFEWKPLVLKMRLFPVDNIEIGAVLEELTGADMVRRFTVDGRHYGAVRNFQRFQRPKKPNALFPMPAEFRTYVSSSEPSSEPNDDEGGGSSPPQGNEGGSVPPSGEPEPVEAASVPPTGEMSPQMEDGGGRRREESSLRSDSPLTPRRRKSARPTPGLSRAEIEDAFETLWVNYPRSDGRKKALEAFERQLALTAWDPQPIIDGLLLKLDRFDTREGGRFVPHCSTWLNQERWRDPPPPAPRDPSAAPLH